MSNGVLIPATDLVSISKLVSASTSRDLPASWVFPTAVVLLTTFPSLGSYLYRYSWLESSLSWFIPNLVSDLGILFLCIFFPY